MDKKIVLIPGLGFTKLLFSNLKLPFRDVQVLEWQEPKGKESISLYAKRMAETIGETNKPLIVLGHSFGGVMAQEIANHIDVEKLILISTVVSRNEIPFFFKMVAPMGIYRFFTKKMTFKTFPYWGKNHGYITEEEQNLFLEMVGEQSDALLQWSLYQLSIWKGANSKKKGNVFRIHGDQDMTFPVKKIHDSCTIIKSGDHLMIYKMAEELALLIGIEIKELERG